MDYTQIINIIEEIKRDLTLIPEGTFLMGSSLNESRKIDSPQHLVHVQAFLIGKYTITRSQWDAISHLSKVHIDLKPDPSPSYEKGDNLPVVNINWYEALEFCNRLSIFTGLNITLPSEAQWEYACRAGTTTDYSFGDVIAPHLANYDDPYITFERETTTPVGSYPSNLWELYDMHGNVWEWCLDTKHKNYEGAPTDDSPWLNQRIYFRIVRGGSWISYGGRCTSFYRDFHLTEYGTTRLGFRVVCSL